MYSISGENWRGVVGGGKLRCYWRCVTFRATGTVDRGGTLLLRTIVAVVPLLLVIAGDVETNPGPGGIYTFILICR